MGTLAKPEALFQHTMCEEARKLRSRQIVRGSLEPLGVRGFAWAGAKMRRTFFAVLFMNEESSLP